MEKSLQELLEIRRKQLQMEEDLQNNILNKKSKRKRTTDNESDATTSKKITKKASSKQNAGTDNLTSANESSSSLVEINTSQNEELNEGNPPQKPQRKPRKKPVPKKLSARQNLADKVNISAEINGHSPVAGTSVANLDTAQSNHMSPKESNSTPQKGTPSRSGDSSIADSQEVPRLQLVDPSRLLDQTKNVSEKTLRSKHIKVKVGQKNKKSKQSKDKVSKPSANTSNSNSEALPTIQNENTDARLNSDEIMNSNSQMVVDLTLPEFQMTHSIVEGKKLFAWLVAPTDLHYFFSDVWEKQHYHVIRNDSSYYENVMSSVQIDHLLRLQRLDYTKNVDITSYDNGVRETHNPTGRALAPVVWDFFLNGCSVRILNPQAYIPKLHLLCATLQEFFGCMVGANSYLTPPGSQGFAPHYDDIEAFIIQIEGKKHWKLYAPRNTSEVLPRVSSQNFTREEIGSPIFEVDLQAGDLLYFPRGTIHEAYTLGDQHSLHVTISMYQNHSYADLLEKVVPGMLQTAVAECLSFRKGLPLDLPNYLGLVHCDKRSPRRIQLVNKIKQLLIQAVEYAPIDAAVDQMWKEYQHSALPPAINAQELPCTVFGDGEIMTENGTIKRKVQLAPNTQIRLIRANVLRMIHEDNQIRVYYCMDNTKEYKEIEPQYLEVDEVEARAVDFLLGQYPYFSKIADLPLPTLIQKVTLTQNMWEKGLLITEKPLQTID